MVDEVVFPPLPPLDGLRTLEDFRAAADVIYSRWNFLNQAGITYHGKRDTYEIFGYKRTLSIDDYRFRYERGGLAGALVDIMPDATWRGNVEVREDKDAKTDTTFEKAWKSLDQRLQVQAKMLRVDKLSRMSHYAVLLIGVKGDATLDQELPKGSGPDDVIFLDPFTGGGGPRQQRHLMPILGADATIAEYESDTKNHRFGQPKTYNLKRLDLNVPDFQRPVHWSRLLHVAEGVLDNEVFGRPALERSWNDFDNLEKLTGGGSEAFWLRANAGMHLDVNKDMTLPTPVPGQPTELDKLKQQAEDYAHQLTRMMRTRGVDIKQLGSDVANFSTNADAIITQIAGANRVPKRILMGTEAGELGSSQDRDNWKDNVNGRQTQYAGPYMLRPLVDRLIQYGYLPPPAKGANVYDVVWPHIQTLTEQEKAEGAKNWATVNSTMGMTVFTDKDIRDKWYGMPETDESDTELWRASLALKMAETNKTQGVTVFTDDEIRKTAYGWSPLTDEQKIPIGAPEKISVTQPPSEDGLVLPKVPTLKAVPPALKAADGLKVTLKALEDAIEHDDVAALDRLLGITTHA